MQQNPQLDQWFLLIYEELRALAAHYLRGHNKPASMQPTSLIHEVYVKLAQREEMPWQNKTHFSAVAATAMRHIVIDHMRRQRNRKHSPTPQDVILQQIAEQMDAAAIDLLALDEALKELESFDRRLSRIVELRFFGSMSWEEIAQALQISTRTVSREWILAKAWLRQRVFGEKDDPQQAGLGKN